METLKKKERKFPKLFNFVFFTAENSSADVFCIVLNE